jgi:AraC-like DNA-binding protein
MGPVADLVRRHGGRPDTLFRRLGLSLRLEDDPERLILLRDQFRLIDAAARSLGDDGFGARLSAEGGFARLGDYARRIRTSRTVAEAITRVNATVAVNLQSATSMWLERTGRHIRWSYRVTEPMDVGRQQNELLAVGYQLSMMRGFTGPRWVPIRIEIPSVQRPARVAAEEAYGCEVVPGDVAGVIFAPPVLRVANPGPVSQQPLEGAGEPVPHDLIACAERLLETALLEGRPTLRDLAERLQITPRTLQRRLAAEGESFDSLLRRTMHRRADELLAGGHSVTNTAIELGYSDTAHFSRAYRSWAGVPPSVRASGRSVPS